MRRSEENSRQRWTPKKTTAPNVRPRRPGVPPRPGCYTLKRSGRSDDTIQGEFPSRAAARRAAVALWGQGGYCWVELPEATGT